MRIPSEPLQREQFYLDLIGKCLISRQERKSDYAALRSYFLFGSAPEDAPAIFNKIYPHIDQLSSFLYSTRLLNQSVNTSQTTDERSVLNIAPDAANSQLLSRVDSVVLRCSFSFSVSVKKYAGGQEFSVELLDRSSPAFFDELVRQMEYAYAKATDVAVVTGLIAGGTDGGNRTLDAAGLLDFVSDAGLNIRVAPRMGVDDGIQAVRRLLPRCWFNVPKVKQGLDALRNYRRDYDEKRKIFYERPLHDWSSHASDAFRYLAIGLNETSGWSKMPTQNVKWIV